MLKLKFNLRHQDIQLVNKGVVVATDSKDYLVAKFNTISDDWETPLTAIFTDDKHKQPYAIIVGADERLAEDECFVPWEVLTDAANVYVSVYCGNLHTTVAAAFKVRKSGYIEGETPPPPSSTVYDIIMQAITDLQTGKQDKLTAGENITINANGEISATGGTDDYEELTNKPQINGHELSGNKTAAELRLQDEIKHMRPPWSTQGLRPGDLFIFDQKLYRWQGGGESFMRIGRQIYFSNYNPPEYNETTSVSRYDTGDLFVKKSPNQAANSQGQLSGADVYLCTDVLYWPTYGRMHYAYTWQKINIEKLGVTITSATVNSNGTITFTMSDGSTVTTTGESVIGPQGDVYVLTAQDKSDIAAIVLSELPTTQGVLYGNTSN